jgi:hypothetical protein
VVDTLDSMLRAGPKHLTVRQWQAGQIFRSAYETLSGACGGSMDFDRVRGGGVPGQPFGERQLHAGNRMNEAQRVLYSEDMLIIEGIGGLGESIDKCASRFYGRQASKADKTKVGDRLRIGLEKLAESWVPEAKKQPMRTWRPREAIPRSSLEAARGTIMVTPNAVAHASPRGVKISGGG